MGDEVLKKAEEWDSAEHFRKFACYKQRRLDTTGQIRGWESSICSTTVSFPDWQESSNQVCVQHRECMSYKEPLRFTHEPHSSLWGDMCRFHTPANWIGKVRQWHGELLVLKKKTQQKLSSLHLGCVIILLGGHFHRQRMQSIGHNCCTFKGQNPPDFKALKMFNTQMHAIQAIKENNPQSRWNQGDRKWKHNEKTAEGGFTVITSMYITMPMVSRKRSLLLNINARGVTGNLFDKEPCLF